MRVCVKTGLKKGLFMSISKKTTREDKMKSAILIILSGLLIASCSACNKLLGINRQGFVSPQGEQSQELDFALKKFNEDIMFLGYSPIDFSETIILKNNSTNSRLNYGYNGLCESIGVRNKGKITIEIDSQIFNSPEYLQIAVIYHEIGHCFLGLNHVDTGSSLMTNKNIIFEIGSNQIQDNEKRISLVKEMLESSDY